MQTNQEIKDRGSIKNVSVELKFKLVILNKTTTT
jgi:hypothetical protein